MGKKTEKASAGIHGKKIDRKPVVSKKKTVPAVKSKTAPKAVKKAVKAPAKPAKKVVKTTVKPAARKVVKTTVKPVAKPVAKKAVKTTVKSAAKKAVKATVKPVAKSAAKAVEKIVKAPVKTAPKAKVPEAKAPVKKTLTRIRKDEILKKLRLSKADKKYFRELLLRARAAFGAQVQYHSDDALTRKDAAGERAGMATHMADLGTDNYRRDFQLGLLSDGVDVLEMIDEALQRLEDSEYGICLDCGEPIPRKRLEAKPYAKYCTKCKSKREEQDESFYHRR